VGRNADLVRLSIELFNERGVAGFSDPDVRALMEEWIDPEIESYAAGGVQGGAYQGIEGMIEMVSDFTSAFSELRAEMTVLDETEDSLVASVRYSGSGATSGAPIDETYVWALRFRDGKAVTYVIDRDREGAVRLAGLDP
jgi:ketosteroid isomerase-like protein